MGAVEPGSRPALDASATAAVIENQPGGEGVGENGQRRPWRGGGGRQRLAGAEAVALLDRLRDEPDALHGLGLGAEVVGVDQTEDALLPVKVPTEEFRELGAGRLDHHPEQQEVPGQEQRVGQ